MIKNLLKAPLVALFYSAILYLSFLIFPINNAAAQELHISAPFEFMPVFIFSLLAAVFTALILESSIKKNLFTAISIFTALAGCTWFILFLEPMLFGRSVYGIPVKESIAAFITVLACSLLFIVLSMLVFKYPQNKDNASKYKVKFLGLSVKLICSPVIFAIIFFTSWYFFFWKFDYVREFLNSPENSTTFISAVVNMLLYNSGSFIAALLKGFSLTLFSIPLLVCLPHKKVILFIVNLLTYSSASVLYLSPAVAVPPDVRLRLFMYNIILCAVFSLIASLLLSTSTVKAGSQLQGKTAPKSSVMANPSKAKPQEPRQRITAKDATGTIRSTMQGTTSVK